MIQVRGVHHAYGDTVVLDGIDLELSERRIGVVGANGSGKSTLARMLNGLVLPARGSVTVNGLDTHRDGAAVRQQVGFVFTDPDAQIVMPTVAEDVEFSLRRRRLSRAERQQLAAAALERYGLAGLGDRPAHLLSGGQKQLLALAAVLVTEPSVLVCDEPTTLLDLRNSLRVAELVAALPQQVVMVTHHLELLADYDRVIVVDQGRVAFDGAPDEAITCYRGLMQVPGP
ncbi:MAG: energy-coupling factor ABC transporter ATP-binding protein [Angustibacter sp.]